MRTFTPARDPSHKPVNSAVPRPDTSTRAHLPAEIAERAASFNPLPYDLARVAIYPPGGAQEQEADRVADRVIALPAGEVAAPTPARTEETPAPLHESIAGPGKPLEPALRRDMEGRFGHDFSQVRVHADQRAADSAAALGANAC